MDHADNLQLDDYLLGKKKIRETKERRVCRWRCVWLEMFSPSNTSEKTNLNFNESCLFIFLFYSFFLFS